MFDKTYEVLGKTALNDPKSSFGPKVNLQNDGNAVFASFSYPGQKEHFVNLMESPAGFGETKKQAVMELLRDAKFTCRQPLWYGWGGPAGLCGEQAYGSEIHPNSMSHLLSRECARCPKHGGFDVGAVASLVLMYRSFGEALEFAPTVEPEPTQKEK